MTRGIFLSMSRVGLPLFWMDIWVPIFRCENVITSWIVLLHIIYSKQRFFSCGKKMINVYHSAFKTNDVGLLIWSDGIFIFWTYHTPHMISVFLCCKVLGTLICIWNNGRRYSICCFTILHTAISLSWTVLLHIISSKQCFSTFKILMFFKKIEPSVGLPTPCRRRNCDNPETSEERAWKSRKSDIPNVGPHIVGITTSSRRRKSDVQNVGPRLVGIATVYKRRKSDAKNSDHV